MIHSVDCRSVSSSQGLTHWENRSFCMLTAIMPLVPALPTQPIMQSTALMGTKTKELEVASPSRVSPPRCCTSAANWQKPKSQAQLTALQQGQQRLAKHAARTATSCKACSNKCERSSIYFQVPASSRSSMSPSIDWMAFAGGPTAIMNRTHCHGLLQVDQGRDEDASKR